MLLLCVLAALAISTSGASAQPQSESQTPSPRPSSTPSATPVPYVQLPHWMRDPNAQVIALRTYDDMSNERPAVTFLNVETGERFPLGLAYVHEVGWVDSPEGVYIHLKRHESSGADNSEGFHEYVDLDSGSLVRLPIGDSRAPVSRTPPPPEVDNGAGISFRLVAQAAWESANRENTGYRLLTYGDIILANAQTSHSVSLYHNQLPELNLRQLSVQWFGEGRWLGVWYTREENGDFVDEVNIFDSEGNWHGSYNGFGQVRWSADHNVMLFRDRAQDDAICLQAFDEAYPNAIDCEFFPAWEAENSNLIVDFQWSGRNVIFTYRSEEAAAGGLCWADVDTGAVECPLERSVENGSFAGSYHYLPGNVYGYYVYRNALADSASFDTETPRESGVCLVSQRDYSVDCLTDDLVPSGTYMNWEALSPSGELLAFMYTGQGYTRHDGVCIVSLRTGVARCPDAPELIGFIDTYGWSPDSRYFLVMYNGGGPLSDDKTFTRLGIVDAGSGTYHDEGFAIYEPSLNGLWRPALAD